MKLIQVNAWLGRLNGPLERFIEREQPDFVCMQEAYLPESEGLYWYADQYNFLATIRSVSGLQHEFFAKNFAHPMGDITYQQGNVILSRFPLSEQFAEHTNGQYHVKANQDSDIQNTRIWQSGQTILPSGQALSLANYHGYLEGPVGIGAERTRETMQQVADGLTRLPRPLIFAGDLNVWPSSSALKTLDGLGLRNLSIDYGLTTTLSEAHRAPDSDRARAMCDYIFVSEEIRVTNFYAADDVVSDHKALILEFEL